MKKYLIALPVFKDAKGFNHKTILVKAKNKIEAKRKVRLLKPFDKIGEIKEVHY